MRKYLYSIFDKKTATYSDLFTAINDHSAIRIIASTMDDQKTMLTKNPEDFNVTRCGIWNDALGEMDKSTEKKIICEIQEIYLARKKEERKKEKKEEEDKLTVLYIEIVELQKELEKQGNKIEKLDRNNKVKENKVRSI